MHPYKTAPVKAFWSRAVSQNFDATQLIASDGPLIRKNELVATAGSCFASNLVPYLEQNGFNYLRTAERPPVLAAIPAENLGYDKFSAAYGNIYTVRQLYQLLMRCLGRFQPIEDRWFTEDSGVLDPFRPGLRYRASTEREFELLTAQYLRCVKRVFTEANVFIFTLGLTEAWVSKADGAVFPACPGTVGGIFEEANHEFVNFGYNDIATDLQLFIAELERINSKVRIILTVSPVPLVATATGAHVLCASTYSKSVLRAVAGDIASSHDNVAYFPAYEIITGPQAPESFFEADRRNVSVEGVRTVMGAFLAHCEGGTGKLDVAGPSPAAASHAPNAAAELSQRLADGECEEAMADG